MHNKGKPKPRVTSHAKSTKVVFNAMRLRLKTNPGGGYPRAPVPGGKM